MAKIPIGTCGFSYKEWVGPFYPDGTKAMNIYIGLFCHTNTPNQSL